MKGVAAVVSGTRILRALFARKKPFYCVLPASLGFGHAARVALVENEKVSRIDFSLCLPRSDIRIFRAHNFLSPFAAW